MTTSPSSPTTETGTGRTVVSALAARRFRRHVVVLVTAAVAMFGLAPVGTAQAEPTVTVSFSTQVSDMTVSVQVTAVTGVNPQFCWYFGDEVDDGGFGSAILCRQASAFGPSASHTYAAPGTYTITVVVNDALGIGGGASQQVTVPGSATIHPPTAAFTTSVSGLTVAVDGSGSRDVDGTVVRWCYDFGAGAAPTCQATPRTSYTYVASGTYVILLTVTDSTGVTGSLPTPVTVTAPAPAALARDTFTRTVSSGWGSANTGGAWTVAGTSNRYSVSGGLGLQRVPAAATTLTAHLAAVTATRSDTTVSVSLDKAATGGGTYVTVTGRRVGTADYSARLKFNADRTITLYAARTGTALKSAVVPTGAYTPGSQLRVRVQVLGTSPTTVRARAWALGAAEPTTWQVSTTDTTVALQTAGVVGLSSYLSSTATNAPVSVRFDELTVTAVP